MPCMFYKTQAPVSLEITTTHQIPTDIPLSMLSIDFINGLPLSRNSYDVCMAVTCKTSKFVRIVLGKEDYTAETWAGIFYRKIWAQWGMPDQIISDRESKFTSDWWARLFEKIKVRLAFT